MPCLLFSSFPIIFLFRCLRILCPRVSFFHASESAFELVTEDRLLYRCHRKHRFMAMFALNAFNCILWFACAYLGYTSQLDFYVLLSVFINILIFSYLLRCFKCCAFFPGMFSVAYSPLYLLQLRLLLYVVLPRRVVYCI